MGSFETDASINRDPINVLFCLFSDTWEVLRPMPQDRSFGGCVALPNNPDNILLVGSWAQGDP
jgi:hypothetical protein